MDPPSIYENLIQMDSKAGFKFKICSRGLTLTTVLRLNRDKCRRHFDIKAWGASLILLKRYSSTTSLFCTILYDKRSLWQLEVKKVRSRVIFYPQFKKTLERSLQSVYSSQHLNHIIFFLYLKWTSLLLEGENPCGKLGFAGVI